MRAAIAQNTLDPSAGVQMLYYAFAVQLFEEIMDFNDFL